MTATPEIRPMGRAEFDVLVEWAAAEGWNPGRNDNDIFWATDPGGFVAAEMNGELIGGGSIVSYGPAFGFMGFFIVRPDLRGRGLGRDLWYARRQLLLDRLDPTASIGMDGVFDMVPFYEEGGFVIQHRDIRFEGRADSFAPADPAMLSAAIMDAAAVDFEGLDAYDRRHFPARRSGFLRSWISQPGGRAVVAQLAGDIVGFAASRPCREGHKIGPLFAEDSELADQLFNSLCAQLQGEQIQLDVPECNPAAMAMAKRHGMVEVFGCAKMFYGPPPDLPNDKIYGVTTFELG